MAEPDQQCLQRLLRQRLLARGTVELVPAAPGVRQGCARNRACLREAIDPTGAEQAVSLSVGRMGDVHVLRLQTFDANGARLGSWQQRLPGIDDDPVSAAFDNMIDAFTPRPALDERRWYQRWWVWTAAAAAVVAATSLAVVLSTRDGTGPDTVVEPPP